MIQPKIQEKKNSSSFDPGFTILKIEPDAKFEFKQTFHNLKLTHEDYFTTTCQPYNLSIEEASDETEICIGLDFGTSSLKSVIAFIDDDKLFCVRYFDHGGIEDFLLPTEFFIDENEICSLKKEGQLVSHLKNSLMAHPGDLENQGKAIAYLALVFQYIRGWIFNELENVVGDSFIHWKINFGFPSASIEDKKAKIWLDIAKSAWVLSLRKSFTLEDAQYVFIQIEADERKVEKKIPFIQIVPEISAELYSIITTTGDHDNGRAYGVIDVGSGTVDFGVFLFTKGFGQKKYSTYLFEPRVELLGTSECHEKRIKGWLQSLIFFAEIGGKHPFLPYFLKQLEENIKLGPNTLLSDSFKDYFPKIKIEIRKKQGIWNPDETILIGMARNSRELFQGAHDGIFPHRASDITLYVAGGGCTHPVYLEGIERMLSHLKYVNCKKPDFEMKNLETRGLPFSQTEAWKRLAVAYGLAAGKFGEIYHESFDKPKKTESYQDNYIGPELI